MTRTLRVSLAVYAGLMVYLVAVKLVLTILPHMFRSPAQAAVFPWPALAVWAVL